MVVGDDVAVVALDDDARAGRPGLADAHLDGDHRRGDAGGDVGHRAGLAGDARVDLGQLGAGREQRRLGGGAGEQPADPAADRTDQQDGEQDQRREPHREVAQAQLLPAPASTTTGPGCWPPRRRRRPARPSAGRGVRVAPGVAAGVGLPPRPRRGPPPAGAAAGGFLQPGRPGAGRAGRRGARPRAAAAGTGRWGGVGRSPAKPAVDGSRAAEGGLLARGRAVARRPGGVPAGRARRERPAAPGGRAKAVGRPTGLGAAYPSDAVRPGLVLAGGSRGCSGRPALAGAGGRADGEGADDRRDDLGVLVARRRSRRPARPGADGCSARRPAGRLSARAVTPTPRPASVPTRPRRSQRAVRRTGRDGAAARGRPTRSRRRRCTVSSSGPADIVPGPPPAPGTSAVNGMAHSRDSRSPGTATSRGAVQRRPWPPAAPPPPCRHCRQPAGGGRRGRPDRRAARRRRGRRSPPGPGGSRGCSCARPSPAITGAAPTRPGARWASACRSCTRPAVDAAADGAELDAQGRRDLLVGQALDVAEDDGDAELRGERVEGRLDLRVEVGVGVDLLGAGRGAGQPLGVLGQRVEADALRGAAPCRGTGWS